MLAEIIAHQSGPDFYRISGPEIFSKWVGQSEELLRGMFDKAANSDKAIIKGPNKLGLATLKSAGPITYIKTSQQKARNSVLAGPPVHS